MRSTQLINILALWVLSYGKCDPYSIQPIALNYVWNTISSTNDRKRNLKTYGSSEKARSSSWGFEVTPFNVALWMISRLRNGSATSNYTLSEPARFILEGWKDRLFYYCISTPFFCQLALHFQVCPDWLTEVNRTVPRQPCVLSKTMRLEADMWMQLNWNFSRKFTVLMYPVLKIESYIFYQAHLKLSHTNPVIEYD